jgi:outer membrane protein assembly factor BamE
MHRTISAVLPGVILSLVLAACGFSVPRIPGVTPYKMEIQQGNQVTQETLAQLKPGMSREQVRAALGTPLLTDIFHGDRWDYVFWRESADGTREERKIAVHFRDGKLLRVDGDVVAKQEAK